MDVIIVITSFTNWFKVLSLGKWGENGFLLHTIVTMTISGMVLGVYVICVDKHYMLYICTYMLYICTYCASIHTVRGTYVRTFCAVTWYSWTTCYNYAEPIPTYVCTTYIHTYVSFVDTLGLQDIRHLYVSRFLSPSSAFSLSLSFPPPITPTSPCLTVSHVRTYAFPTSPPLHCECKC